MNLRLVLVLIGGYVLMVAGITAFIASGVRGEEPSAVVIERYEREELEPEILVQAKVGPDGVYVIEVVDESHLSADVTLSSEEPSFELLAISEESLLADASAEADSLLTDALLEVEDVFESRSGYRPDAAAIATFDDLAREIDLFLAEREGFTGAALYRDDGGLLFGVNVDEVFPLASVVKVHVLLTYLDAVQSEERELTPEEEILLELMIVHSDNYAADVLWEALGSGRVADYLESKGLEPLPVIEGELAVWGSSVESPRHIAVLFDHLYAGDLLNEAMTERALQLLSHIDPSQTWGISAGLNFDIEEPPALYMKDGWFPAEEGWRLNSAGVIQPAGGWPPYTLVLLTYGQPSFDLGLETIETVASLINGLMRTQPPIAVLR
jgi:hypothetical protein